MYTILSTSFLDGATVSASAATTDREEGTFFGREANTAPQQKYKRRFQFIRLRANNKYLHRLYPYRRIHEKERKEKEKCINLCLVKNAINRFFPSFYCGWMELVNRKKCSSAKLETYIYTMAPRALQVSSNMVVIQKLYEIREIVGLCRFDCAFCMCVISLAFFFSCSFLLLLSFYRGSIYIYGIWSVLWTTKSKHSVSFSPRYTSHSCTPHERIEFYS